MLDNLHVLKEIFLSETEGIDLRNQMVFVFFLAIVTFVPPAFVRRRVSVNWRKLVLIYLFLIYIFFVLSITILRRPEGSREGIVHLYINLGLGLKTGNPSFRISAYSIYNILLFLPFGFFAYLVIRNKDIFKSIITTTILGLCCSFLIEFIQLLTGRGMFELTDILTNTAGSLLGTILSVFAYQVVYKCRYEVKNEGIIGK